MPLGIRLEAKQIHLEERMNKTIKATRASKPADPQSQDRAGIRKKLKQMNDGWKQETGNGSQSLSRPMPITW